MRLRAVVSGVLVVWFAMISMAYAEGQEFSITGKPRWFQVKQGEGPVVVRALATHAPLGELSPGSRILSFGVTESWVTFGYNGHVGYVPKASLEELYPEKVVEAKWRGFGPSLEDKVKEFKNEIGKYMQSQALYKPKETPKPTQMGAEQGGAGGDWRSAVRSRTVETLTPQGGRGGGYY
ncbi:MAG: hypothetical protein D6691_08665 [Candidatus Hydrogenedentota bacterium]|nr:MAG: hypothetical protein D6691_08665 [Candidatus Hydrogenedentota bacterium]GIX45660.1 MAG: hypothetical protein KatS3mg130_2068 [Candidatus Sumerlaea sp.]